MHVTQTSFGIVALASLHTVMADFHLALSDRFNYLPGGDDNRFNDFAYLPSNDYTCTWMRTAGHGHGTEVTPKTPEGGWPAQFTSISAICGERDLMFKSNANSGYDLIQQNGENAGSCYRNFGGKGLDCSLFGISWGVAENYVCYSYLCNP